MRPVWALCAFLGCSGAATRPGGALPGPGPGGGALAAEDWAQPTYGKADLQRALIAERGAEATAERRVAELEAQPVTPATESQLRFARADLAVLRRFIGSLEACEATGQACPPRLDDPPWSFDPDPATPEAPKVDAALRFDLDSWRVLAAELHGRACACRTITCVDSLGVAIDQLEPRPMPEVQGDEDASRSLTRARECLYRLRGRKPMPGTR